MINTDEFSKRLQNVIDYYSESASSFAQKIEVQRSSISHILSGRNKPSLDFVLKILDAYPEVELYWLLNGKGQFPKSNNEEKNNSALPTSEKKSDLFSSTEEKKKMPILESDLNSQEIKNFNQIKNSTNKQIERIVIFYSDGSFSNFENS
jgi:transcriptional regulator with XRE-family HTH domain